MSTAVNAVRFLSAPETEVAPFSPTGDERERILSAGLTIGGSANCRKSLEARVGIEPTHKGFADLSLSHLGTAPCFLQQFIVTIGSEPLQPAMEWRASKTSCTFAPFVVERVTLF